jgi:hypothetical protein
VDRIAASFVYCCYIRTSDKQKLHYGIVFAAASFRAFKLSVLSFCRVVESTKCLEERRGHFAMLYQRSVHVRTSVDQQFRYFSMPFMASDMQSCLRPCVSI